MLVIYFKYSASYNNKNNNIITIDMYTQTELVKTNSEKFIIFYMLKAMFKT